MNLVGLGDGNASHPASRTRRDVSDEEWAFVAPYLTLMTPDAPQRVPRPARGLQRPALDGAGRRAVALSARRLPAVGGGLPADAALAGGRAASRTWSTTCARCCAGRRPRRHPDGGHPRQPHACRARRRAGRGPATTGTRSARAARSTLAVDTLGHLLALRVTPANAQDRDQVAALAAAVQEATGEHVEVAFVDQGYTGDEAGAAAAEHGIRLEVVRLPEAKRGFVLLPRRWVVERSFAWAAASAASPGTTSGCRRRSRACISSPSPA